MKKVEPFGLGPGAIQQVAKEVHILTATPAPHGGLQYYRLPQFDETSAASMVRLLRSKLAARRRKLIADAESVGTWLTRTFDTFSKRCTK